MSNWKNEQEARNEIKELVTKYYHAFKEKKEPYQRRPAYQLCRSCF